MTSPRAVVLGLVGLAACGDETAPQTRAGGGGGGGAVSAEGGGGSGGEGGAGFGSCAPGELAVSDACVPAGIPPEACLEGFEPDGQRGCRARLPSEPCGPGEMALPGETNCRPVAPCGEGKYGDLPDEPGIEHVDGSYAGGGSDGSAEKPWTSLEQALDAAAPGAILALSAGSYALGAPIEKPVRIWGRCPSLVSIGPAGFNFVVGVFPGASKTEIRRVAITGKAGGVFVTGAEEVRLEEVWLHDLDYRAVTLFNDEGPTGLTLRGSLVERATDAGAVSWGSHLDVEQSVIRDTRFGPDTRGRAIAATVDRDGPTAERGSLAVRGSILERSAGMGLMVEGTDATVERTLVRGAAPAPGEGFGMAFQFEPVTKARASAAVSAVIVEGVVDTGVLVASSDATLEHLSVRDVMPASSGAFGRGINLQTYPGVAEPTRARLAASTVASTRDVGIYVGASEVELSGVLVRDVEPAASDQRSGRGISVAPGDDGRPSLVSIRGSRISRTHLTGIFVAASEAKIEGTRVEDVAPQASDGRGGVGIYFQHAPPLFGGSKGTIRRVAVARAHLAGIAVFNSEVSVEDSLVEDTRASPDGRFGDGLAAIASGAAASLSLAGVRIEGSARAGLSLFSASARVEGSSFTCNAIDMNAEAIGEAPVLEDAGGNRCGCDEPGPCRASASKLEPPEPLESD